MINNYTNLKDYLRRHSKRLDAKDEFLDDFIAQAESEMFANSTAPIRTRAEEVRARAVLPITDRYLQLPDFYTKMRALHILIPSASTQTRVVDVLYRTPEQMRVISEPGRPEFFTVTSQLEFNRIPIEAEKIEMSYYVQLTPLSPTNEVNDILNRFPNIYIFGSLWALWTYYSEEEKSQFYFQQFIESIRGANKLDKIGRFGPAPRMRIEGRTP